MQISISNAIGGGGGTQGGGTPTPPPFSNVNSFSFDGVDDYFIGTSTYSELDGQNKATISFWAKFNHFSNARILTSVTRDSNLNNFVFMLCNVGNSLRFFTSSTSEYTYSNAVLTANTWLHIMIAIDKTQGSSATRCKIFINGQDETSSIVNQSASALQTSNSSLYIGENQNGKYSPMLGFIDEFAIWSGTDLRNDVATIYNNGTPTDLNNNGLTAPTTWQRMGEDATWNGATWTMTDVNGGYTNRSIFMVEANRTTDVPTASTFSNTKSIALDGVDDFVTMGNVLNMADDGTDSFSCSFWMKRNSFSTEMIVSKQLNSGSYNGFAIYISQGRLNFLIGSSISPNANLQGRSTNYVIGSTWNNVILTYDGSQDISGFNVYINGVSDSVVTLSNNTPTKVSNTTGFRLSGRGGGAALVYGGGLDEVAFWNGTELTSTQANEIGSTIPTDLSTYNPTSWWRCGDGDTSPTLTDNGSGGNDGTMVFFNTFSTDVPT